MDDEPLDGAPDDPPEGVPDGAPDEGAAVDAAGETEVDRAGVDEAAGVVRAAEALVEAAALEVDLDATAADLDGVDAALRRLDDGTYGTCEVCAVELTDEALAADPTTRRCPAHVLAPTLPGTARPPDPPPAPGLPPA
ncbi:MAG TPA: hypothetical protein PKA98_05335 [Acidimicrobiales bacterium]|nr:hypothetical protein [Acidimicrobiales bacterium]